MLGSFELLILPGLIGCQLYTYEYHGFRMHNKHLFETRLANLNEG